MIKMLFPLLLLAPALAMGDSRCAYESTSELGLELDGVSVLQLSVGPDRVRLVGSDATDGTLRVRMCASSQERLDALRVAQSRRDGRLVIELDHGGRPNVHRSGPFSVLFGSGIGSDYGSFEIEGQIPAALAVDLTVGSGKGHVENVAMLESVVGSGDLEVRDVEGPFHTQVGSGDVVARRVGGLDVGAIGSGEVSVTDVRGEARVGTIGSGDLTLRDVEGSVAIGAIGSGDARLRDVGGDVEIRTLGSGDIDVNGVEGRFTLRSKGSGDVRHRGVQGAVDIPNR